MGKYILNKTPLNTSKNYGINDIELELDIPKYDQINDYKITGNVNIEHKELKNLTSKIGLSFEKYHNLKLNIPNNSNNELLIEYNFNNEMLIDNIEINAEKNSNSNIIIKYTSNNDAFHHLKQVTNLEKNAKVNITILNLLEKNSRRAIFKSSKIMR